MVHQGGIGGLVAKSKKKKLEAAGWNVGEVVESSRSPRMKPSL
jgi:hypothetical protein